MGDWGPTTAVWGSLPVQLTRLFGRETELAELAEVVDRERLVSLVGAPG